MGAIKDRLRQARQVWHAWNAFVNQDQDRIHSYGDYGGGNYGTRPDRNRVFIANERSIIASIYTRMSIDVASVPIRHVRVDEDEKYIETIKSRTNDCLSVQANLDQDGRMLIQDVAATLFDKGVAAIVPIDTTVSPDLTGSFDIASMRCGDIVQWMPRHVRVNVYNEQTGRREELTLSKSFVAIVENPLYGVMNEPNSTLQRVIRTLGLLDMAGENSASGKLDIIMQLPYAVKSETRKQQADQRRTDIEAQLRGSKYGIAWADATEKITQLNRPAENQLLPQAEFLIKMLYGQLGITEDVMNGTADEAAMINYYNRTIEPVVSAIVGAMRRSFLTKTARTQGQTFAFYRDAFKLLSLSELAEIVDKLARNEVVSSNEFRQALGLKPSKDPKADQLRNSNMPEKDLGIRNQSQPQPETATAVETQ